MVEKPSNDSNGEKTTKLSGFSAIFRMFGINCNSFGMDGQDMEVSMRSRA